MVRPWPVDLTLTSARAGRCVTNRVIEVRDRHRHQWKLVDQALSGLAEG